jgi:spermidine synthase
LPTQFVSSKFEFRTHSPAEMATKTPPQRSKPQLGEPRAPIAPLPGAFAAAIVFIAAGSVLVLEILSVRLLAPYVGLTLETTTSIIGAVLLGIALGAGLGGRVADRMNPRRLVIGLLIGGGLLALLTVPIVRWLGPTARDGGNAGALKVTFAALVPVAAALSAISPTVAHWQLRDLRASGTVVGGLSAWATGGALVGTFGTGFVLVPLLPVSTSVLAVGVALVFTGVALGAYTLALNASKIAGAVLGTAALGVLGPALHSPCNAETSYHCVRVEVEAGHTSGRLLYLDEGLNSYVDLENPRNLGTIRYTRWIADQIDAIAGPKAPLDVVFVGGGGLTLPRWLAAAHPGSRSNVLEVDGQLIDFDRDHLGLRTSPRLRATTGDARLTMGDERPGSADVIVGDAFSSRTVPWQLMTVEWLKEVRRVLRPDGVYALNMIDYPPLSLLRAEAATLQKAFANVRLIAVPGEEGGPAGGNEVLLASSGPLPHQRGAIAYGARTYERPAVAKLVAGAKALRDDYAPVDQLQTRPLE